MFLTNYDGSALLSKPVAETPASSSDILGDLSGLYSRAFPVKQGKDKGKAKSKKAKEKATDRHKRQLPSERELLRWAYNYGMTVKENEVLKNLIIAAMNQSEIPSVKFLALTSGIGGHEDDINH